MSKTFGTHIISCRRINAETSCYKTVGSNKCLIGRPSEWIGRQIRKLTWLSLSFFSWPIHLWSYSSLDNFCQNPFGRLIFPFWALTRTTDPVKLTPIRSTNQQPGSKFFLLFDVFCKEFYIYHLYWFTFFTELSILTYICITLENFL